MLPNPQTKNLSMSNQLLMHFLKMLQELCNIKKLMYLHLLMPKTRVLSILPQKSSPP